MLDMLDAIAVIRGAILPFHPLKEIKHGMNRAIADRVNGDLQARLIRPPNIRIQPIDIHKVGAGQATLARLIGKGASIQAVAEPKAPSAKLFKLPIRSSGLPKPAWTPMSARFFQSRSGPA
jgi:hypothetical protein